MKDFFCIMSCTVTFFNEHVKEDDANEVFSFVIFTILGELLNVFLMK